MNIKRVAIAGASGFIGGRLTSYYRSKGVEVLPISRELFENSDYKAIESTMKGADLVINLSGAPISKRWSEKYKRELYASRIDTTSTLARVINSMSSPPSLFISPSAVGYYGSDGCYDEYSSLQSHSFLSSLCRDWERAAQDIRDDVRVVITRFGVVFDHKEGSFPLMTKSRGLCFMPYIGSGKDLISWIDINDLIRAIDYIATNEDLKGVFNLTSPTPISHYDFAKTVSRHFKLCYLIRIPSIVVGMAFGEGAQVITENKCVKPTRLEEAGFIFDSPTLADFLKR